MSNIQPFLRRKGETATRFERQLDARIPETGWPRVDYTGVGDFASDDFLCTDFYCFVGSPSSNINLFAVPIQGTNQEMAAGLLLFSKFRIITSDTIEFMDRIVYQGETYVVDTEPQLHYLGGLLRYRVATMTRET